MDRFMMHARTAPVVRFGEMRAGIVAWSAPTNRLSVPLLVIGEQVERYGYPLEGPDAFKPLGIDFRTMMLVSMGDFRFDPRSGRGSDDVQPGDLLLSEGKVGFYLGRLAGRSFEPHAIWLDGTQSIHHHQASDCAYSRWELGLPQDGKFVRISCWPAETPE